MKPKQRKWKDPSTQSIAERAWNGLRDALGITTPPTYTDGYGNTRNAEVPFWEGAQGQELKRMGETAKTAGQIGLAGAGLINPFTASSIGTTLLGTLGNVYGLSLGAQNVYNTTKKAIQDPSSVSVPEYIFAGLDAIPFVSSSTRIITKLPSVEQVNNTVKRIGQSVSQAKEKVGEATSNLDEKIDAIKDVYDFYRNRHYTKRLYRTSNGELKWTNNPDETDTPITEGIFEHNNGYSRINSETGLASFEPYRDFGNTWTNIYPETKDGILQGYNMTLTPGPDEITIPKSVMTSFWKGTRDVVKPGTYISGDVDWTGAPIGQQMINQLLKGNKSGALKTLLFPVTRRAHVGLTPDSYSSIIRQGQRPGYALRFGAPYSYRNWGGSATENTFIYDLNKKLNLYKRGKEGGISPEEYKRQFDAWAVPLGGKSAIIENGDVLIPHPFLYVKDNSTLGKLTTVEVMPKTGFFARGNDMSIPSMKKIGEGSEQTVFDNGDKVFKVRNDRGYNTYKDAVIAGLREETHRNFVPGQLPIKNETVLKGSDGKYYPTSSQQKVSFTFEDDDNWKTILSEFIKQMQERYGYNFGGPDLDIPWMNINGKDYKIVDVSPYNIGKDNNGQYWMLDVGYNEMK